MKQVFITGDSMITSLGFSTDENFMNLLRGETGIQMVADDILSPQPLPLAAVDTLRLEEKFRNILESTGKAGSSEYFTRLEKMMILSIADAQKGSGINLRSPRVLVIISTTKGNINLLEERYRLVFNHKRLFLWELGRVIRNFFDLSASPLIVSNACISGIVAILAGARMIRQGRYDHVVVCGGDILTEFVISGFQSFQSLSPGPCKPYDASRDGLSLGESASSLVLSAADSREDRSRVIVEGGSVSNDANHISGPSRTGAELALAIQTAMEESGLDASGIDYISAHGTATSFNDEMESKALHLAGLGKVPVNSFKGYWGHTLGAAGIVESAAAIRSLTQNTLIRSAGFESLGVPEKINVITSVESKEVNTCLKTASGFGGCNAAVIFRKL